MNKTKLPLLHYKKVVKALKKAGFEIVGSKGSHLRLKRKKQSANDTPRMVIVPMHPEIARGTLRNILRRTGLTLEELLQLV